MHGDSLEESASNFVEMLKSIQLFWLYVACFPVCEGFFLHSWDLSCLAVCSFSLITNN